MSVLFAIRLAGPAVEGVGAGEGNRTLVVSLEGCCSTIELHPLTSLEGFCLPLSYTRLQENPYSETSTGPVPTSFRLPAPFSSFCPPSWWRGLDSNQRRHSQRVYSPSPLTTRAPLLKPEICPHRKAPPETGRGVQRALSELGAFLSTAKQRKQSKNRQSAPLRRCSCPALSLECEPERRRYRRPCDRPRARRDAASALPLRRLPALSLNSMKNRRKSRGPKKADATPSLPERIYGVHAVSAALANPNRQVSEVFATRNGRLAVGGVSD